MNMWWVHHGRVHIVATRETDPLSQTIAEISLLYTLFQDMWVSTSR